MMVRLVGKRLPLWLCALVVFRTVSSECILEYVDLENSLFASDTNIDSLTRAWFPPNEQNVPVVEVFYYINNSEVIEHPLILELGGVNETELRQRSDYRYRWSVNPIYLFMDPQVLEALSLYAIRILNHNARLVVAPICENYTVRGIRLPEFQLNQMTSLLRSYAIMRSNLITGGIVEQSQGYASYYNSTRGDFIVLEFDEDYQGNMFLLAFSLIALAIFVTLAVPLLIYAHYEKLYDLAKDEDSTYVFLIWGTVTVAIIVVFLVLVVDILFVAREISDGPPSLWQYILTLALVIVLLVFDFVIAMVLAMVLPTERDFPIPKLMKFLPCLGHEHFAQIIAIWFVIMAMQLITFHASFVFLAFIASPVQAASTALLYTASVFCAISLFALFFAVFQKGRRESHQNGRESHQNGRESHQKKYLRFIFRVIYVILFMCVLAFVILFSTCFLRVTIYVGDFESGGLPALFASLAPSILLGGLGFIAERVLRKYDLKKGSENGNEENTNAAPSSHELQSTSSDSDENTSALQPEKQGSRNRSSAAIKTSIV